jgi:hypothetical protein
MIRYFLFILFGFLTIGCQKEPDVTYLDDVRSIKISDSKTIDNGFVIKNPIFNYITYNDFLKYITSSGRFLVVPQKDLIKTESNDKVIISFRHDIDDNINSAVKFAYLEHKYGIKASYYILHTANYYGLTKYKYFKRNDEIIYYLKKIQNSFGHEIGWHNDLVTLQVIYGISPKTYLREELKWLRNNGIEISGNVAHGSPYCHIYHYLNSYFWLDVQGVKDDKFYNKEFIKIDKQFYKIEKDSMKNYSLEYEDLLMHSDYYFADCDFPNGKRWHMGMVNFDTIKPGKKVIILLHPQHWD